jgi:hypothetical protein
MSWCNKNVIALAITIVHETLVTNIRGKKSKLHFCLIRKVYRDKKKEESQELPESYFFVFEITMSRENLWDYIILPVISYIASLLLLDIY